MNSIKYLTLACAGSLLFSCGEGPKQESSDHEMSHDEMHEKGMHHDHHDEMTIFNNFEIEKNGLRVYSANIAKEFPDAELKMVEPPAGRDVETGKFTIEFEVANYELAKQTDEAENRHCANSQKGQHIHFIVNNGPYQALYEPKVETELLDGNNVILAFLSRSYHESIKNGKAHVLKSLLVGEGASTSFDHEAPHLFYSRPKGTYKGKDSEKILLDFYLINSRLAEDGNKVRVLIDDIDFELPSWQPYFVEGLSAGSHSFRIQLIDKDGHLIDGPFNDSGVREISIEK